MKDSRPTIGNLRELSMAVLGDIHLGHRNNPTSDIIANLEREFPDTAETAALDIIFIEGDLFDSLLNITDLEVIQIQAWLIRFMRQCKRHNTLLRILEGTRSHDRNQFRTFFPLNELAKIGADVKYFDTLSVEHIDAIGIDVLYVPDDLGPPETTIERVKELLRAKGLSSVHYAIMHGQFEYQLPPQIKAPKHDSQQYLSLVSELIFIGHVHSPSRYDRIIASGSFDRLTHNEEHPKGHTRHTLRSDGSRDVVFVENTNAKLFVTVDCSTMDLDDSLEAVDKTAASLPTGSFIRVMAMQDNPILQNIDQLVIRWPHLQWSKKPVDSEDQDLSLLVVEEEEIDYVPIQITPDNIMDLLSARLLSRGVASDLHAVGMPILKEIIG